MADVYGRTQVPLYVMNVAYPLIENELLRFCKGKRAVLVIEEGQPNFVEQNIASILQRSGITILLHGKDILPLAGEYTSAVLVSGLKNFLTQYGRLKAVQEALPVAPKSEAQVHARPPGFCTGCPERPIFTAIKMVQKELGEHHISADIGCHLFSILPPFNLGNTTMGYGLGGAGTSALNAPADKRAIAIMGDGGFWHNGLTSGIANSVFNRSDNLTIIVDNSYTSATGGQDIPSSTAKNPTRSTNHSIDKAVKGVGVRWVKTVRHTYDLKTMTATLREALTTTEKGPKVLIAQSECMLNKQRREKAIVRKTISEGKRSVRERFGVDPDTCTGDRSCIRLSGCPSLSIKPNADPLRTDPVTTVLDSCVGCGLCGEVAHAAILCPSFYRAEIVSNPTRWDRLLGKLRSFVIERLQSLDQRRIEQMSF